MAGRLVLLYLCACLFISACATLPESAQAPAIGPYRAISARLLVIEPTRRWQVMLDWQTDSPTSGRARLVHAASDTVVEVRWQKDKIELRDNRSPEWRKVSAAQLAEQGIVVTPYVLSQFLAGRLPSGFRENGPDAWESSNGHTLLRVNWNAATQHLDISDIRHGRQATLIILSGKKLDPAATTPAKDGHNA
jgi:hypothetical protein